MQLPVEWERRIADFAVAALVVLTVAWMLVPIVILAGLWWLMLWFEDVLTWLKSLFR